MPSFLHYIQLTEQDKGNKPEKRAVFTFGRFNPPTVGHAKLIDKVMRVAGKDDHFIFSSQTVDKKKDPEKSKNPLDWDTKIAFMKKMFPKANIVKEVEVKSPFHVLEFLEKKGYTDIVIVAGSDRVPEYDQRMRKYADDLFNSFEVVDAGQRDPDADDATGASATKAREAAKNKDMGKFRAITGLRGDDAIAMMKAVRDGMGVE